MIEWLGIGHLSELSRSEAIAAFCTPLVIFGYFHQPLGLDLHGLYRLAVHLASTA